MTRREQKKDKKALIALLLLLVAVVIIIGTSLAFFSDVISGGIGGTAGTLDIVQGTINSKQAFTQGGVADVQALNEDNINPGDYILVDFNATNAGNKSAWVRTVVSDVTVTLDPNVIAANPADDEDPDNIDFNPAIDGASFFTLYEAPTLAEITTAGFANEDAFLEALATNNATATALLTVADPDAEPTPVILNGVGTAAETETDGIDGATGVPVRYIVYFSPDATNELQGAELAFGITVQAIQYRNNATVDWTDVVTEEFQLTATP